jgi:very-short-patch-repair endonuclease
VAASTRAFPSPPCQAPAELTRSELENAFLVIAERHNLPRPRVGVGLGGYTADFLWPEAKLIVETDGLDAHGTTRAFEHDRRRDRRLLEMGYRTVRLTGRALELDGAAVARQLRAILAQPQAGASAGSRSRSSSKPPSRASSSSASAR